MAQRTQVGIIGAGPAGLVLSHLLARDGIESVVLERRSRDQVEATVRAGVLEQGTVDLLTELGLADRLHREGAVHHGIELRFGGRGHRIDLTDLTGGRAITLYAQHELLKDLIQARLDGGGEIRFETEAVAITGADDAPVIQLRHGMLKCDVVAGCDGFHGIARKAIPTSVATVHERLYPFAWFGILAEAPPSSAELVYCLHERGFALVSTRSPELQRLYFQCDPATATADWPDERVWAEFAARLATDSGWRLATGPILRKDVLAMRSVVTEPMQHGRLYLAGDAAHIVPPTGAKGLNLAVADVRVLARALAAFFRDGRTDLLERYSATCLARIWKAQRFSSWMTSLLHRHPDDDGFRHRLQLAELDYLVGSRAAATALAENYVGLPMSSQSP